MKMRNAVISFVFALLLLGPLLAAGAMHIVHIALPEWLSPQSATYLLGGKSSTSILASLNYEGISSGYLQNTLEDKVEDCIPCKKTALLTSAALQRSAIEAANGVFRWETYPTFYGSKYVFISGQDALARMSFASNDAQLERLEAFSRKLASFVQAYPETRFCLILVDQSDISAANPTFRLVDGAWSCADYVSVMSDWTQGAQNLTVVAEPYDNTDLYYHDYYRSDHHWNGYGALKMYEKLAELYELPSTEALEEYDTVLPGLEDVIENGSNTRYGLMMVNEPAQEPSLDLSDLVLKEGSPAPVLYDNVDELLTKGGTLEHNIYEAWYGYRGYNSFVSENGRPDNALIVCDSFGTALKYPLARAFERTDVTYDLHLDSKNVPSLAESIEAAQPSTVFFVARLDNYANCLSRFPSYLDFGTESEDVIS